MPNPVWPASLPTAILLGANEEHQAITLETPMEQGPPKRRKRFTANIKRYACRVELSDAQKDTFVNFWKTTCNGGVTAFDWKDPGDQNLATIALRFANPPPATQRLAKDRWLASFTLETEPA